MLFNSIQFVVKIKQSWSLIILVFLFSCRPSSEQSLKLFSLVPSNHSNITFRNDLKEDAEYNILNYLYFYNGGGVAVGDINNDGLSDVYFSANNGENKLYLNKGNFKFDNITQMAGVASKSGWKTGITMADVNGDGYLDIYVCKVGSFFKEKSRNELYINNKDNTFSERAEEYNLDFQGLSTHSGFFDYDRDGDLDMFLLNHSVHSNRNYGDTSLRRINDPVAGDRLFRNDGNGYTDVTHAAGIYSSPIDYGLGLSIGDINQDGWPDIYVSNDFHENDYLYYNNGDGTFTEGIEKSTGHTSRFSMGNDLADINNDGMLDLIVADMLPEEEKVIKVSDGAESYDIYRFKLSFGYHPQYSRNTLQSNTGIKIPLNNSKTEGVLFSEIGQMAGVSATDWSWATLFADLDNDGLKDLFISNGIARRPNNLDFIKYMSSVHVQRALTQGIKDNHLKMIEQMPVNKLDNYAYKNLGDFSFKKVTEEWGLENPSFSNGAAYADLDNDGDLDLIVNNINDEAFVYRNNSEKTENNYLSIKLTGKDKNKFGVGAKVLIKHNSQIFYQEQMPSCGFESSVEQVLHFGIGKIEVVDSLIVIWNSGNAQILTQIKTNQRLSLNENKAYKNYVYDPFKVKSSILENVTRHTNLDFKHQENKFIDMNQEILIPHMLSNQGPKMEVADINGDDKEDFFIGGAKGQPGQIFIQIEDKRFEKLEIPALEADKNYEDVDAVFFDADKDDDLDLFIVSGGNEQEVRQDRLYLNQTIKGSNSPKFEKTKNGFPNIYANGSCVIPLDFDQDGDLDLFLGSRSIPGRYGISPLNFLLENDGKGGFTDVTGNKAPILMQLGMVTDGVWVDLDNSKTRELVLVGEWMPLTVLEFDGKELKPSNIFKGFENTNGWWNCLSYADIDNDGDQDLLGGNLGLNSIIKAGANEPVELWVKDFDGNGTSDPVLTYFRQGKSYPAATKDELLMQIVSLKKKYVSYQSYAGKRIQDIFTPEELNGVVKKQAFKMESCLFKNMGNGEFSIEPLPREAQVSPIFSFFVEDIDNDGIKDILIGGNLYTVGPYRGKYDAGFGLFLKGTGNGGLAALNGTESGFIVKGEVRDIKKLNTSEGNLILVSRNNESLQVFKAGFKIKEGKELVAETNFKH